MNEITYFADVIIPLAVPNKYTYRVPRELYAMAGKGKRALVQFGKTRIYTGIISKVHSDPPLHYTAKYLEEILDDQPVVNDMQLRFWDWVSFYYCANPGDVMNAALPSGLRLSSTSHVQIDPEFAFDEAEHSYFTDREHKVIDALHATPGLSFDNIADLLGVKSAQYIINKLIGKKAVVIYEDIKEKYRPKMQAFLKLHEKYTDGNLLRDTLAQLERKTFRQAEVLIMMQQLGREAALSAGGWVSRQELLKKCEGNAITALVKKSILIEEEFETGRLFFEQGNTRAHDLSSLQTQAFSEIESYFDKRKPVLLHGVTGSGKTEIYVRLIQKAIEAGKQVLYLIPEIALTTQLITRVRAVFGEKVGVYHSRFSENERVEIWNQVLKNDKDGKFSIIMGARSCLFLPFSNLGLIIVDEEHDPSFKQQDPAPRYNARDCALYLAAMHQSNIVSGTATPSVESYQHALDGKFGLVKLGKQYSAGGGTVPVICDLTEFEKTRGMKASLTPPLFEAINEALKKKEQVILFQNRRGFAPYTECRQCGHVPQCVQCDVSLIYHKQKLKLVCHYCGYTAKPPVSCSACGSNRLHFRGMGTEKIEEDIEILFPGVNISRMDFDSTRSKYAYRQIIEDFESGKTQILIGTQMVTKGLDFLNVGVVGVINADSMINFPDFRAFERAFQLITQVRGRAGRGDRKGRIFIQTSQPSHPLFGYVLKNDIEAFYTDVLRERKEFGYPPFSRLIELSVVSADINEVSHLAEVLGANMRTVFGENVLGPEFPIVSKIRNRYYKRILVKVSRQIAGEKVRKQLFEQIARLDEQHRKWRYQLIIDVDPV